MKTFAAFLLLICALSVFSQTDTRNPETQKLYELFDSEWQWTLENNPTFASYLGDKRYNARWDDVSLSALEARNRRRVDALARLKQIDRSKLQRSVGERRKLVPKRLIVKPPRYRTPADNHRSRKNRLAPRQNSRVARHLAIYTVSPPA